jgi:hypothetical protein
MKASQSVRVWFAFMGTILWIGIYFTGFGNVNWLIYTPAVGFIFAATTGICPSQITIFNLFGIRMVETPNKKAQ